MAISEDEGKNWSTPRPITVNGLPPDFVRPFDPTLTLLDDGRVRLYFTDHPRSNPTPAIYSAISTDGERYQFEPGVRFGVEGERVIDCAVGRIGKTWHLYAPVQNQTGRAYHAVSEDGLRFTRRPDIQLPGSGNWLGCAVTTADGLRFYGTGPGGWSATSRDGATWKLDPDTRMPGADPGVAPIRDGRYLLIATGPRRADAPTPRPPGFGPAAFGPPDALPFPPPGPRRDEPVMTATSEYLYILRSGTLYQYNARDLTLIRRVRLPEDREPMRQREP